MYRRRRGRRIKALFQDRKYFGTDLSDLARTTNYGLLRLPGIHFKEWLNLYLSYQLPSKIEKLSAQEREKRKSDSPLLDIQENIAHKNCKSIKWNPPISIDEVRSFEREHGVALPDEYVEFITKIADGCFHFKATNSKNQGGTMFRLQDFSALKRLTNHFHSIKIQKKFAPSSLVNIIAAIQYGKANCLQVFLRNKILPAYGRPLNTVWFQAFCLLQFITILELLA